MVFLMKMIDHPSPNSSVICPKSGCLRHAMGSRNPLTTHKSSENYHWDAIPPGKSGRQMHVRLLQQTHQLFAQLVVCDGHDCLVTVGRKSIACGLRADGGDLAALDLVDPV